MTIAEMVRAVGLAQTSMRQQVERLALEGWLVRERRCRGPGRPADVFSISDQSRRLFIQQQIDEFAKLLLEEVADAARPSKLRSILRGVSRRMIRRLGHLVDEGSPTERVQRLAGLLCDRGILSDASGSERDLTLHVYTCPYHGLANEHREICEMDCETMGQLVGRQMRLDRCMLDGDSHCEFQVVANDIRG
jgi:predicted ArsR family transcriptional regulator